MTVQRTAPDFTVDLPFGEEGERYVKTLLQGLLSPGQSELGVEVKRDDKALSTGNIYLEHSQQPRGQGPFVPSGLKTTRASHFAVVIGNTVVIATVSAWRWVGNKYGAERLTVRGDNPTKGRVVPLHSLILRLAEAPFTDGGS